MQQQVVKRDGQVVLCEVQKIINAVNRAAVAANQDVDALEVAALVLADMKGINPITVEHIQDLVEQALMASGAKETAKAYILYRNQRERVREGKALIKATNALFDSYLGQTTWQTKENANTRRSVNGMNNFIRERFTEQYWLNEIYPKEIKAAHESGALHLHDLGFFGPYCCGWDLRQLLVSGFGGVEGKVSSKPARHLRSFLGQIVNATFTYQGECAGAQAWSSFDTYTAPFIRYDNLSYAEVKQAMQEFIFNLNVPTRVGFQCPFSNLTFDLIVPASLRDVPVIRGGVAQKETYGMFEKEMSMLNLAFCEVMEEGDASSRVFTFPIPTYKVTKDFPWESEVVDAIFSMTAKYGIPYFSNYVNSDLSPEDALSMCCRLRLDTSELKKRGGGLFGSNPLTGSIGVVTLNLPRLAYETGSEQMFFQKLPSVAALAKESLEIKRKVIEAETERGMYPFSQGSLVDIKQRLGKYWANHFSTIGLVGMEEACLNLFGPEGSLVTQKGQEFALRVLKTLRDLISGFQEETGNLYNLEATPAEGASYRLARLDLQQYPDIVTAGENVGYYTNSSQLPVGYTSDLFETLEKQDELQCQYTGGTVLHLYLAQRIKDVDVAKNLVRKTFTRYKLPYVSLTPTFSTCKNHGYLDGEVEQCPYCGETAEIWTRVVGYLRPKGDFHPGKQEEHRQRRFYEVQVS
ncbi:MULTISPECIES: ribonucleoside triphosphate reductase [Sphaerochaeta]|jgi:ribonucleoside-triphosphate reductase|uniref:Ribonucleoside triphosphate reductase n=1 Tax=Sphaerochaeta associata TaxID=1129264 RepID=A0ABY4DDZ7_9SPIR|nr:MULTISPECIES: ribonucleoside triphosphate reductase [Sphaerochaeta]MDT3357986.1 ribonucleoside triphosphate reductase [Spirochaetota bacterium]MDD2394264.1 ribonucleoside triphosphate reductase [Sphaerochaeta sp.]MDD3423347.1 ribonucleoside triphosphate reductase [Sphaerochaeta sp.]MDD3455435.1 ribonucleoside triphosphate reductase [Sphaerochaeta sp.]MDD4449232.1 ribonucleoside triphosphate reductase [Sphaerochaeta sp.]